MDMKIKSIKLEINGHQAFLSKNVKSIIISNDLEVIGRFNRKPEDMFNAASAILDYELWKEDHVDYGSIIELESILKAMC